MDINGSCLGQHQSQLMQANCTQADFSTFCTSKPKLERTSEDELRLLHRLLLEKPTKPNGQTSVHSQSSLNSDVLAAGGVISLVAGVLVLIAMNRSRK